MKAYEAWYACFEEHGTLGYFTTEAAARKCLEQSALKPGAWTEYGDKVLHVGVSEIEIHEELPPLPAIDPSLLEKA